MTSLSSSSSSNNCAQENKAWELASEDKLEELIQLLKPYGERKSRQLMLDCALMGAASTKVKTTKEWAFVNGACLLWDIQQAPAEFVHESRDQNNRLKMIGGKGEVSKGTFSANQ